jgi:hypothetical protein
MYIYKVDVSWNEPGSMWEEATYRHCIRRMRKRKMTIELLLADKEGEHTGRHEMLLMNHVF